MSKARNFFLLVLPAIALATLSQMTFSSVARAASSRTTSYFEMCAQCHGLQLEGNPAVGAPAISGLPAWYVEAQVLKFRAGHRGKHPRDIGGMRMRPLSRTLRDESDVKAISEYVASLPMNKHVPTIQGDVEKGKAKFQVCVACHQADLAGNEALKSPPLKTQNDWYLVTQLHNFKGKVRGAAVGDASGASMAPMAATLEDDQAILDVVAYINTLR